MFLIATTVVKKLRYRSCPISPCSDVGKPGQRVFLDQMLAYELIILGDAMYVTPENLAKMKILTESELEKHSSLSAFKVNMYFC